MTRITFTFLQSACCRTEALYEFLPVLDIQEVWQQCNTSAMESDT